MTRESTVIDTLLALAAKKQETVNHQMELEAQIAAVDRANKKDTSMGEECNVDSQVEAAIHIDEIELDLN
jgi:hypothetical protein